MLRHHKRDESKKLAHDTKAFISAENVFIALFAQIVSDMLMHVSASEIYLNLQPKKKSSE